jgi:glycosyltransferase involved in cell wall biosynthesis
MAVTRRAPRVLHVIPSMGYGGAERQAAYLAHGLGALGHQVHFALFAGGENLPLLERSGATVHRLAPRGNYDPRRFFELADIARRVAPDLIQTWLNMANVLGGLVALRQGVPWVYSERYAPDARENSLKVAFDQWFAQRRAAAVISNSTAADGFWAERLPAGRPHGVIRNALPLDEFDTLAEADPRELDLPPELPLVVYIGRLLPHKGIDTLLDALERVNAERPIAALLLGVGDLQADVATRLAAPAFAGRARAPGFRFDTAAWLKRASVFVSLSHVEGMPNTVMEAMAARCPVVLSDIPQHREILAEDAALFAPLGDAAAAAAAIRRCLDEPAAAAARAARAREAADAWSVEGTSQAWAELYRQLLR